MYKYKLSRSSNRRIKEIDSRLTYLVNKVIQISPHDFGIPQHGGLRTAEEQNKLFQQVPKVTNMDGYNKLSYHQSGKAFDIYIYDEHGACWECIEKFKEVADVFKSQFNIMKSEGLFLSNEVLRWGGDWTWKDRPHFEIKSV